MASRHPTFLDISARPDLRLRKIHGGDGYALMRIVDENRTHLEPQVWTHAIRTAADAERYVRQNTVHMEYGNDFLQYRVLEGRPPAFPRMVGTVTLHSYDSELRQAFLGYWLTEDVTGKGYASASSRRLIEYGKEVWDLQRLHMSIAPDNIPSQTLAKALGAHVTDEWTTEVLADNSERLMQVWSMPV